MTLIQIEDGEDFYPESCVEYVRFRDYAVQLVFSYFREMEWVLMSELEHEKDGFVRAIKTAKLHAVQGALAFISSNLPGRALRGRRRKRKVQNGDW